MCICKNVISKADKICGKINPHYDLSYGNMLEIKTTYSNINDAICCAFRFGYLQGMKAARAEEAKAIEGKSADVSVCFVNGKETAI